MLLRTECRILKFSIAGGVNYDVRERKGKKRIGVNIAIKDLPFIPTLCLKHLSHVEPDSFERFGLRTLLHLVQNLPGKFLSV